jgi:hypothetical protein
MSKNIFQWSKRGRLFDPTSAQSPSWMVQFAQSPSVLFFEDRLRIYFCTRGQADAQGQFVSRIGFIDVERENLFKIIRISESPVLDTGARGCFDEFGTNPVSVIRCGDEIRAYYAGWTRTESVPFNGAIGMAKSMDGGETFSRLGPGPILSYSLDEPFVVGSPKIRHFGDTWHLHYAAGQDWIFEESRHEPVYRIRHATSVDGVEWTKAGVDLIEKNLGSQECQASPDIFFRDGLYHMFFSYRHATGFKTKERGYRIGYAYSPDLVNWHRRDEWAGLDVSEDGWDCQMVSYAHVFELDGNLHMLYQGNEVGRYGFGLATLVD